MDNFLRSGSRPAGALRRLTWFGGVTQGALVGTVLIDKLTNVPPAAEGALAAFAVTCAIASSIQLMWSILRVRGLDVLIFGGRSESVYIVGWRFFKRRH